MKKIVLLLLSFFFLESVWCQYYRPALASSVVNMPTCMGDGAICRSYGNAKVLVHHVDLADRHRHHFALQLSDTNVISELVVTLGGQNDVNDTLYEIRDMRVLGDTCYFCGRRKVNRGEPVYDNWGHVLDPGVEYKGVLGWFPISDFRSQSVEVNVYHADFAQDMSRLTVRRKEPGLWPWYDLKVTAIGIDAQGRQCVTEMITPSSSPLMCGGWGITNYVLVGSNDELFCDVLDTEMGTLLLAVDTSDADGIDRHRKLVLHNIYREGLSGGNFSTGRRLHFDEEPSGWGWHSNDVTAKMAWAGEGQVSLAFPSVNIEDGRSGIVHVMLNSEGDFLSGSVVDCSAGASVQDVAFVRRSGYSGVLLRDNQMYDGAVMLIPTNTIGTAARLNLPYTRLQSVCNYFDNTFFSAGFNRESSLVKCISQHPLAVDRTCVNVNNIQQQRIENVVAEKANYNWEGAGPSGDSFVRIGTVLATGRVTECSQPLGTAERL